MLSGSKDRGKQCSTNFVSAPFRKATTTDACIVDPIFVVESCRAGNWALLSPCVSNFVGFDVPRSLKLGLTG